MTNLRSIHKSFSVATSCLRDSIDCMEVVRHLTRPGEFRVLGVECLLGCLFAQIIPHCSTLRLFLERIIVYYSGIRRSVDMCTTTSLPPSFFAIYSVSLEFLIPWNTFYPIETNFMLPFSEISFIENLCYCYLLY